ncbi:MAG: 2-oxoacid:acceptor oxidoreductase family protein [Lachnospiraceae bacterium]|nr:2-oxoacid:acceptor oxidoreductase family protein [Lachnospiraceae bacterium]
MITNKVLDGNEAAAYSAYAFSDAFCVYPITPSTPMAEHCEKWIKDQKKNIYGKIPTIYTMQSEKGVGGMLHGLLRGGSLATTFTSSQGLLLMLPVLYRLAGEHLPAVIHVASRSVATNALSIYGDHSDIMAVRGCGAIILASSSVQEAMIMSAAAHKLALECRLPVIHFFDGFDTSHEIRNIKVPSYEDLCDEKTIKNAESFRNTSIMKDRLYGPALGPDIFFEVQEASNGYYTDIPDRLDDILSGLNKKFERKTSIADYHGSKFPHNVIVSIGSVNGTICEVLDEKMSGNNACINLHLFRPFPSERLNSLLVKSVRNVAVLDRCKDVAAANEPLMSDVVNTLYQYDRHIKVIGGHYGLASKDTTDADIRAVFNEMNKPSPIKRFSIGINDDHNHTSLKRIYKGGNQKKNCKEIVFYACGSEGAVSACRTTAQIIAESGAHIQCKSYYDARKSGNLTTSEMRISQKEINASYRIKKSDIAVLYSIEYLPKAMTNAESNSIMIINTAQNEEEFKSYLHEHKLPSSYKFYLIDAVKFSELIGSAPFINTIMSTAALVVLSGGNEEMSKKLLRAEALSHFCKKYGNDDNSILLSLTAGCLKEYIGHGSYKLNDTASTISVSDIIKMQMDDGSCKLKNTTAAPSMLSTSFPVWDQTKCVQCNACVNQCPHSAIRAFVLEKEELPEGMQTIPSKDIENKFFRIQVSPDFCLGCKNCSSICRPGALKTFASRSSDYGEKETRYWELLQDKTNQITPKNALPKNVREAGFNTPLLESPGSCAGCAQSTYLSLLTRIFKSRLIIANATGCSSIWGGTYPYIPYKTDENGNAPTFANSLFENNAEFGAGISESQRLKDDTSSVTWIIGGDGWASDIDSDGIDYLLNHNADINILILDNGSYANTGGQYSSLTPLGADCPLGSLNKSTPKDIAFQYIIKDNVYVASVCIGADLKQTFDAITEAAQHKGPSVVIAYCPCRLHGIKKDESNSYVDEQIMAVRSGFRYLYRYNPDSDNNKLILDKATPNRDLLKEYMLSEGRFDKEYVATRNEDIFAERVKILNKLRSYSFLT